MTNSRFPEAKYTKQGLPEYDDNPLISALPEIMSLKQVVGALHKRPTFNPEELNLPVHIRVHAINRLTHNFFVPQTNHIQIEQKISKLIRSSYLERNPKEALFKRKLNNVRGVIQSEDLTIYRNRDGSSPASSMTIAGISGAGKSTTVNAILDTYPRTIYHPELHMLQVPWLKVDCPHDGSLTEFCLSFFIALDKRLDTNYREKYTSGRPTIGKMMADVADLCLIHAVGLIVIDEFQHMSLARSGGEKKMINFLVTLINVVEVSIVLIGTPKALRIFSNEFRQARRASGDGSMVWDRIPKDESWDDFLKELWPYQWLKHKIDINEMFVNALYDLSQGVPDIVIKLFSLAQARSVLLAREPEEEKLSVELFNQVFKDEFSIVQPMLDALRSGNRRKIEECNDLVFPDYEVSMANAVTRLVSKPLERPKPIETGEPVETNIVNSAVSQIVSMGVSIDIARPLVTDSLAKNPNLTLIEIIQLATTALTNKSGEMPSSKNSKKKVHYTSRDSWNQLDENDLRKMYSQKSGSMYELLKERNVCYPVNELMVS